MQAEIPVSKRSQKRKLSLEPQNALSHQDNPFGSNDKKKHWCWTKKQIQPYDPSDSSRKQFVKKAKVQIANQKKSMLCQKGSADQSWFKNII